MKSHTPADVWAVGDAYEPFIGRWSRGIAREFLAWLDVPRGARWLDVGCGTGALCETVLSAAAPDRVHAADASFGFTAHARRHTRDERALFAVADARALPWASTSFDAVVSGLVLNFVPAPEHAASEMARVARRGGMVAAYVWDYADGMQLLRRFWDAAVALDPDAAVLDEARRFPLCEPATLAALLEGAGLDEVRGGALEIEARFADFDDLWSPFLGGQGPAPSYVAGLDEPRRSRLRERLRAALPCTPDGAITLTARAWAIRGLRT